MRKLLLRYFVLFSFACTVSCTPPVDSTPSSTFSCGVLSTKTENISAQELTLKVRFFVLDGAESDQLTKKIIENKFGEVLQLFLKTTKSFIEISL